MEYEQILVEQRGNVMLLTLNRPERLNAWTPQMLSEMTDAITVANADPAIGAVVVTGAGRGFCAGADIGGTFATNLDRPNLDNANPDSDNAAPKPAAPKPATPSRSADWVQFCRSSKPLIAAINGPAIGVGLTMVLPFDRLVAAQGAKISARFIKMGLVPELSSSHFLVARCGWGNASWLALSGTTVLGDEAKSLGLVDRVVADGEVVDAALADAAALAENPAPQLRMIKQLLTMNASETDLGAVQQRELEAIQASYKTPEHHEAVRAFLEKRPPRFDLISSGTDDGASA